MMAVKNLWNSEVVFVSPSVAKGKKTTQDEELSM